MFFDHFPGAGYVCAHRGARALAPENTMLAAELCMELGADFWEMDVHKIADGSLVVFHDDVLSRTTNVAELPQFADRAPWRIQDFTLEELQQLDAGSWFLSKDPYGTIASGEVTPEMVERIRGQRIPTLLEALEFSRYHFLPMNIEIKDQKHISGDSSIIGDVLEQVREIEADDLILISSFNHEYLAEIHSVEPSIPLAALVEERHPKNIITYLRELGAKGYHPYKDITDPTLVSSLAAEGIRVTPYTVNDMDQALALVDAGCFGVTTDYTHTLREQLSNRER